MAEAKAKREFDFPPRYPRRVLMSYVMIGVAYAIFGLVGGAVSSPGDLFALLFVPMVFLPPMAFALPGILLGGMAAGWLRVPDWIAGPVIVAIGLTWAIDAVAAWMHRNLQFIGVNDVDDATLVSAFLGCLIASGLAWWWDGRNR